jgi:hypothetical protein
MNRRTNQRTLLFSVIGLSLATVIAVWQFYLFVTFKNAEGIADAHAGIGHFWWAALLFVIGCFVAFVCLRVFLFDDAEDDTKHCSPFLT